MQTSLEGLQEDFLGPICLIEPNDPPRCLTFGKIARNSFLKGIQ